MATPALVHTISMADQGVETRVTTDNTTVKFLFPSDASDPEISIGDTFIIASRSTSIVELLTDTDVTITSPFGTIFTLNDRVVIRKVQINLYEVIEYTSGNPPPDVIVAKAVQAFYYYGSGPAFFDNTSFNSWNVSEMYDNYSQVDPIVAYNQYSGIIELLSTGTYAFTLSCTASTVDGATWPLGGTAFGVELVPSSGNIRPGTKAIHTRTDTEAYQFTGLDSVSFTNEFILVNSTIGTMVSLYAFASNFASSTLEVDFRIALKISLVNS